VGCSGHLGGWRGTENYPEFRQYLLPVLNEIAAKDKTTVNA